MPSVVYTINATPPTRSQALQSRLSKPLLTSAKHHPDIVMCENLTPNECTISCQLPLPPCHALPLYIPSMPRDSVESCLLSPMICEPSIISFIPRRTFRRGRWHIFSSPIFPNSKVSTPHKHITRLRSVIACEILGYRTFTRARRRRQRTWHRGRNTAYIPSILPS